MTTLEQIRFMIERYTGPLDNAWMIQVANDAQSEFSLNINIPSTTTISLTASALEYPLPVTLKIINRLWLQSDRDAGIDKEFKWTYRVYNGKIIFTQPWRQADTLNIDYYKHMTYFTNIADTIDLDDRFTPLYTSYGQREYYSIPSVIEALGDTQARREWEKYNSRYMNIKQQVISYYSIQNEPVAIEERW